MAASVEVQFSGNTRTYHYQISAAQWVTLDNWLRHEQKKDCRVVVPGKIKDDRLSLSIANVVSINVAGNEAAVLPVVALISPDDLAEAKLAALRVEAQALNQPGAA